MHRNQMKQYMRLQQEKWRAQSPEAYKECAEKCRLIKARLRASDPRYKFQESLRLLARIAWFREELPWRAHKPVLYEEKVPKQCTGCDRKQRAGGLKLWYVYSGNDMRYDAARCR